MDAKRGLEVMAEDVQAQLQALKRQQELLGRMIDLAALVDALGCDLTLRGGRGGDGGLRVMLDLTMPGPVVSGPVMSGPVVPGLASGAPDDLRIEGAPWKPVLPSWLMPVADDGGEGAPESAPEPEAEAGADPEPEAESEVSPADRSEPLPEAAKRPAPARGAPWSEDEDAKAVEFKLAGLTVAEIAARLGRPVPATQFRLSKKLAGRIAAARARPQPQRVPDVVARPGASPAQGPAVLPAWRRALRANLNALGCVAPFTAATDLALIEALSRGDGIAGAAESLSISGAVLRGRVRHLKEALGMHPDDPFSIEDQRRLLDELRFRAAAAEAA